MRAVFGWIWSFFVVITQTVFLSLGQIWAHKVRALLTALGIIIGVSSVIGVVSFLTGMKDQVLAEAETIGTRKMWMWGNVPQSKRATMDWVDVKMSLYEANLLLDNAPSIDILTPICSYSYDVSYEGETQRGVRVRGIWPEWHDVENRQMVYGRPFTRIDDEQRRQVCIVNETAIDELKLDQDPTGDFLLIGGRRFLILGVVETKEAMPLTGGGEARSEIFMPFRTAKMLNPYTWTWFMIQIDEPSPGKDLSQIAADAQAECRFILRNHRGLEPEDEDTFEMEVMQNHIESFNKMAGVITAGAGVIVMISLVVGGIGIMNIMLVSVSERTREIGLRKAVGAKPPLVLLQFLIEAATLCIVGGLVGVGVTLLGIMGVRQLDSPIVQQISAPIWAIVVSLIFCAFVGIFFGMFPAVKAAMLRPIDALRHE